MPAPPVTVSATRTGHLGYWVGQKYWGHGVATEAAGRLTRWGFANLEIDRITAGVATDNPASAAVLRRVGFRQVHVGGRRPTPQHPEWIEGVRCHVPRQHVLVGDARR